MGNMDTSEEEVIAKMYGNLEKWKSLLGAKFWYLEKATGG